MKPLNSDDRPSLNEKQIAKGTAQRLKKYKKLNFFEGYAMYMGVAQLLEINLKKLLHELFDYNLDRMERWTLGQVRTELRKNDFNKTIIHLLDGIVDSRNYIAHEILANAFFFASILGKGGGRAHYTKHQRILTRATYELEQVFFLLEWTEDNGGWE